MPPKHQQQQQQQQKANVVTSLWKAYSEQTPDKLKFIDAFLVFLMFSGIAQFAYCVLVTNFPFNAFLSGCVHLLNYCGRSDERL